MTTRAEIEGWLDRLYASDDQTHMIVVTDTFDYSDYPRYVGINENVNEVLAGIRGQSMTKVMEVYSRALTKEEQLDERRAFNL